MCSAPLSLLAPGVPASALRPVRWPEGCTKSPDLQLALSGKRGKLHTRGLRRIRGSETLSVMGHLNTLGVEVFHLQYGIKLQLFILLQDSSFQLGNRCFQQQLNQR